MSSEEDLGSSIFFALCF